MGRRIPFKSIGFLRYANFESCSNSMLCSTWWQSSGQQGQGGCTPCSEASSHCLCCPACAAVHLTIKKKKLTLICSYVSLSLGKWGLLRAAFLASMPHSCMALAWPLWLSVFIIPRHEYRRRQWHPTPVLLPGKSHGQRSLVGCSPWGH